MSVSVEKTSATNLNQAKGKTENFSNADALATTGNVILQAGSALNYGRPFEHAAGMIHYLNLQYASLPNNKLKQQILRNFEAFFKRNKIPVSSTPGRGLKLIGFLGLQRLPLAEKIRFVQLLSITAALLALGSAVQQMKQTADPRGGTVWDRTPPETRTQILLKAAAGGGVAGIGMTTLIFGQIGRNLITTTLRATFVSLEFAQAIKFLGDIRSETTIQGNLITAWNKISPLMTGYINYTFDTVQTVARSFVKFFPSLYPSSWATPNIAVQDQFVNSILGVVENNSTIVNENDKIELRKLLKYNEKTKQFPSYTANAKYSKFLYLVQNKVLVNWITTLSAADKQSLYHIMGKNYI